MRFFFQFFCLDSDRTHPLQQTRKRQMRRASRGSRPVVVVALEVALMVALEAVVVVVVAFERNWEYIPEVGW